MKLCHRSVFEGFTLLEVLVALVVVGIGLMAVIQATGAMVDNARYLRDKTLAHWVAVNVATQMQLNQKFPDLGVQEGSMSMGDREWFWRVEVRGTVDRELRELVVRVYDGREAVESLVVLTAFVTPPSVSSSF